MTLHDEIRAANSTELAELITNIFSCQHCKNVYLSIENICPLYNECIEVAKEKITRKYQG